MSRTTKARRASPELFLNRELSWLELNGRVMEEAQDLSNPLLERLKFATIVASNLDEFYMVRVAGLRHRLAEGDAELDPAGLSPARQLALISERAHAQADALRATLRIDILSALTRRGIRITPVEELDGEQREAISRQFREQFFPSLTPLAIDAARPFPALANLSVNLGLLVGLPGSESGSLAVVQVPARLPRLIRVPHTQQARFVWLEDVIRADLLSLFPGQRILACAVFRVTRDSELVVAEDSTDIRESLQAELRRRRHSRVVRLEIEENAAPALLEVVMRSLDIAAEEIFMSPPPLDVRALASLLELPDLEDLRDAPMRPLPVPVLPADGDLFKVLDVRDVILHHPYDSFEPVVALVMQAAGDPDVLAIKQTLYRTSGDSPIIRALERAADAGKQVTVVVELRARFDEDSNILWARRLEEAGAHVIYGVRNYKTHAKILLIVRRTSRGIVRYVHLGTGNYNDRTAKLYTDLGFMSSDPIIGGDASAFFNALTGYSDPPRMKKLTMAPTRLRERFLDLIRREQKRVEAGQVAEIRAKMNSLEDEELIRALYAAAVAGVRIRLNVRGVCCLRPGLKGVSQGIEVVSIVDRFLEHSRIFHFANGGDEEVYLSSADWMPRNLDRRVELLFPVESPGCRQRVLQALDLMFRDNVKARVLQPDGTYRRKRPGRGEEPVRAQLQLYEEGQRERKRLRTSESPILEPGPARRPELG